MDVSEREYAQLEGAPVDGTDDPDAADALGPINVVSDEVEVATEEELRRVIQQEGKVLEPEIAVAEHEGAPPPPGEERGKTRGYIEDHPTHFDWRPDVAQLVSRIQEQFPNQTYANTYWASKARNSSSVFAPFRRLHGAHARQMLVSLSVPPRDSGILCST